MSSGFVDFLDSQEALQPEELSPDNVIDLRTSWKHTLYETGDISKELCGLGIAKFFL